MSEPKEREEIQRYEIPDYDYGVRPVTRAPREADLVDYSDHLRHLKLAQIEALEALFEDLYEVSKETMMATVAELRKELGHE